MNILSNESVIKAFPAKPCADAIELVWSVATTLDASIKIAPIDTWLDLVPVLLSESGRHVSSSMAFLKGDLWAEMCPAWIAAALQVDPSDLSVDYIWMDMLATLDPQTMTEIHGKGSFEQQISNLNADQTSLVASFARLALASETIRQDANDWRQRIFVERVLKAWPISERENRPA